MVPDSSRFDLKAVLQCTGGIQSLIAAVRAERGRRNQPGLASLYSEDINMNINGVRVTMPRSAVSTIACKVLQGWAN